jgi:hypothetical protein
MLHSPFIPRYFSSCRVLPVSTSLHSSLFDSRATVFPTRLSLLSHYRRLLRSVSRTSNGAHQLLKRQRGDVSALSDPLDARFKYDTNYVNIIRSLYRKPQMQHDGQSAGSPPSAADIAQLHSLSSHLLDLYEANLEHSRYLFESGWGIKQETKHRIKNTAARVGLEVAEPGQQITRKERTKLTGTAGEGYEIGKGAEIKQTKPVEFDLAELEAIKANQTR